MCLFSLRIGSLLPTSLSKWHSVFPKFYLVHKYCTPWPYLRRQHNEYLLMSRVLPVLMDHLLLSAFLFVPPSLVSPPLDLGAEYYHFQFLGRHGHRHWPDQAGSKGITFYTIWSSNDTPPFFSLKNRKVMPCVSWRLPTTGRKRRRFKRSFSKIKKLQTN